MAISVRCECGLRLLVMDELAGQHAQCPDCGRDLLIPVPGVNPLPVKTQRGSSTVEIGKESSAMEGLTPTSGKAIASLILGLLSIFLCLNMLAGIPAVILGAVGLGEISRSGGRIQGRRIARTGLITGILGCLMLPILALTSQLLPLAIEANRHTQCTNNLKQIGLAMQSYHDSNGCFPPAAHTDAQGKPLLSWRVAILPFIEEQALFGRFNFDEPWDSPINSALMSRMPGVFACPSEPDLNSKSMTTYQVLVGPGALFGSTQEVVYQRSITDGMSGTLMVVESSQPVPWTKPDNLAFGLDQPIPLFGSKHTEGFNALFADGAVRFIKNSTNSTVLRALITRDSGEVVSTDEY